MLATWATVALFASVALYIVISLVDARKLDSAQAFLHGAGAPWRAVVSLTAFSITLGTGLVYVLAQATTTGWLIFLTPLGVLLGYIAIAFYYEGLAYKAGAEAPNFYYLLSTPDASGNRTLTLFGRLYGLFMALTYLLVLGYELQIGSKIIVDSLLIAPTNVAYLGAALFIFGIVAVYTALGGLRAAVSTDVWQMGLIILFLIALGVILMARPPAQAADPAPIQATLMSGLAIGSAVLGLIMAVTTQFYSIVNVNMGSSYEPGRQRNIFLWVGILTGLVYAGVAYFALIVGSPAALSTVIKDFVHRSLATDIWSILAVAAIFSGMVAVLLSTLDNMTISVTQIASENLFRLNPFRAATTGNHSMRRLRWAHGFVSFIVLALTVIFSYFFKDPFSLLLTILFAATVMSPLVATAAWISAHGRLSMFNKGAVAWTIFAATIICWAVYFWLTKVGMRQESVWLHIGAFVVALLLSRADLMLSRQATDRRSA